MNHFVEHDREREIYIYKKKKKENVLTADRRILVGAIATVVLAVAVPRPGYALLVAALELRLGALVRTYGCNTVVRMIITYGR